MISTHEELRDASAAFLAQYQAQLGSAHAEEGRGNGAFASRNNGVHSASQLQLPFEPRSVGAPPLPTAAKVATFEAVLDKASLDEHEQTQREGASVGCRRPSSGAGWLRQFR